MTPDIGPPDTLGEAGLSDWEVFSEEYPPTTRRARSKLIEFCRLADQLAAAEKSINERGFDIPQLDRNGDVKAYKPNPAIRLQTAAQRHRTLLEKELEKECKAELIRLAAEVQADNKFNRFSNPSEIDKARWRKLAEDAEQYARDVIGGDLHMVVMGELQNIQPCTYVRQACERHLADRERNDLVWSQEAAGRVIDFVECFYHIKGFTGPLRCEPWQKFLIGVTFGWLDLNGHRRFQIAYWEVPRKNGKSHIMAAIGLYMLCADEENGPECVIAASTKEQARYAYDPARAFCHQDNNALINWAQLKPPRKNEIVGRDEVARLDVIEGGGKSRDGGNIHFAGIDELHAHPDSRLYDVLETGTGARQQAMLLVITTAGESIGGVCWQKRGYVLSILDGAEVDDSVFGCVYTVDESDDVLDPDVFCDPVILAKANPNWGVSVLEGTMCKKARRAAQNENDKNNFLTKYLNVWTQSGLTYMPGHMWTRGKSSWTLEDFEGKEAFVGLDLASKRDIASLALIFPMDGDGIFVKTFNFLPEARIKTSSNATSYKAWVNSGHLIQTSGNEIDHLAILDKLKECYARFNLRKGGFDQANATMFVQMARQKMKKLELLEIPQTALHLSEPMKWLQTGVEGSRILHDDCPVLRWSMGNVYYSPDRNDNWFPRKEHDESKIDPSVATFLAMRVLINGEKKRTMKFDKKWKASA